MISTQVAISFENATLYRNLQSANRMLEAKNKSLMELDMIKDQFLSNTSHELRYVKKRGRERDRGIKLDKRCVYIYFTGHL